MALFLCVAFVLALLIRTIAMTKETIIEKSGRNIYQIWLDLAISRYTPDDPLWSFRLADQFVKNLLAYVPPNIESM